MHLFPVILVCCFGWLCSLAFAQLDKAFTSSVNFPDIGITCIGNLAAFVRVLLRGEIWIMCRPRFDLEGRGNEKLKNIVIGVEGQTTQSEELRACHVVMLSKQTPSYTMQSLMKYSSHVFQVHSTFLQYHPLQSMEEVSVDPCTGNHCGCIVFKMVEEMARMISRRIPGTVKRLSDSLYLLPSLHCLRNGCHGCNEGLLHVEDIDEHGRERLREGDAQLHSPAAVCEILDLKSIHEERACICIPLLSAEDDNWTNQLIALFKPDAKEFRGGIIRKGRSSYASFALERYKNGSGKCDAVEEYKLASLFILPRLTVVFIQIVLTFWFKVDGFSSFVLAERTLRNYLPDRIHPHRFLTKAHVKSNADNTNACQVLFFRGDLQRLALFLILEVFVSSICSIIWILRVASDGGPQKWYQIHSMPPSKPRIVVIFLGVCVALVMDAFDLKLYSQIRRMPSFTLNNDAVITCLICVTMGLEILYLVACSAIGGVMGIKAFGGWVYSMLQCLVWIKASIGFLVHYQIDYVPKRALPDWWYRLCGLYIFASSFWLNAILAGVRSNWDF